MAEIVLVRHGETEWSANGRHTSHTDLPLIEEGRRRAVEVGEELRGRSFALVLSSPLRRARDTCELAGFGDQAEVWDEVHEWEYGEYEGITTPDIRKERPDWWLWRDGCPGGEQPAEVAARADEVIARLLSADGDALVFAHGHICRVIGARWIEMGVEAGARLALSAGAVCVLGFERDMRVIRRWNG